MITTLRFGMQHTISYCLPLAAPEETPVLKAVKLFAEHYNLDYEVYPTIINPQGEKFRLTQIKLFTGLDTFQYIKNFLVCMPSKLDTEFLAHMKHFVKRGMINIKSEPIDEAKRQALEKIMQIEEETGHKH